MRVLVTGVDGFVGRHLARELASSGHDVVGAVREGHPGPTVPIFELHRCDLTDPWPALAGIDGVVHLAGLSAVGPSFDEPQAHIDTNGAMVVRMAEWAVANAPRARAVVVSSGAVYDWRGSGPIDEDGPLLMSSPCVISKRLVENLADYYRSRGLNWVVARPFNHMGPGQGEGFLLPDLAVQLIGSVVEGHPVRVGDLGTGRDYADVRDVARAYRLLLETGSTSDAVFNVCSGETRTGQQILDMLTRSVDAQDVQVEVDSSRLRPNDPRTICGSAARLRSATGWEPTISLAQCVRDFVHGLRQSATA